MDYEKAYKSALERAKELCGYPTTQPFVSTLKEIFPELAESEDEKIKTIVFKAVDEYYTSDYIEGFSKTDILAWIEKQGEQKSISKILVSEKLYEHIRNICACIDDAMSSESIFDVKDYIEQARKDAQDSFDMIEKQGEQPKKHDVCDYCDQHGSCASPCPMKLVEKHGENNMGISEATKQKLENSLNKALEKETPESFNEFLDEQGEQKPADKVEPKFKVGDWVVSDDKDVHDDYRVCKITKIDDGRYYIEGGGFLNESSLALYEYRLWTIQDAKDGDVLNSIRVKATIIFKGFADDGKHILAYCGLQCDKFIHLEFPWDRDFEPASEYWKNALFNKIKERGYEWDADKLELKKIEQKPEWSEEDEQLYNDLSDTYFYNDEDYPEETYKLMLKRVLDWMTKRAKFLRPNHWKPSDEQIKAVEKALSLAKNCGEEYSFDLRILSEQLKAL